MSEQDEQKVYRSTSQRRTFRACGYKHLLRYEQGWRPIHEKAVWRFGHIMQDVADAIIGQGPPIGSMEEAATCFRTLWAAEAKKATVQWPKTRPWTFYNDRGTELAKLMYAELPKRIKRTVWTEKELRYEVAPGVYELAIPDFYGEVLDSKGNPRMTILDFKTSDPAALKSRVRSADQDVQLPLYAWLIGPEKTARDALYVAIRHDRVSEISVTAESEQPLNDLAQALAERLSADLLAIRQGGPLLRRAMETDPARCDVCRVRGICRRDDTPLSNEDAP